MPKYTIIIPSHNGAERITRALDSIKSQTVKDYELIVVCDKCDDNTKEVAESYGAKTVVIDTGRFGAAENAGLDAAQGEWILFMDDDDWWMHDKVIETIDRNLSDGIDMLYFGFHWQHIDDIVQDSWRQFVAVWNKCWRRSFIGDTRFTMKFYGADADFDKLMYMKEPRKAYIPDILYYYNYLRPGSMTAEWTHVTP